MRKALRRAVGVLLATGVVGLAQPARAQTAPVRRVAYGENLIRTEGSSRLEEMKVELALLSDVATFPYYLGASRAGGNLEVRGYVPNDAVKQHVLELARRHTSLKVTDGLRIQANLNPRRPLRGAEAMLREGNELLIQEFGEAARQLHLNVRPNGLVRVTGSIDSVQEKLAVSRLFRQVTGCVAVVNQLTVRPVLRDGQRVVQVMRDGSQTVPASALGMETQPAGATPLAPEPAVQPAQHTLDARNEELRLPTVVPPKPHDDRPATSSESVSPVWEPASIPIQARKAADSANKPARTTKADAFASESTAVPSDTDPPTAPSAALTTPKLPVSWSRPRFNPEAPTPVKPAPLPTPTSIAPNPPSVQPSTALPAIIGSSIAITAAGPPSPTPQAAPPAGDQPARVVGPPLWSARRWKPAYEVRTPETQTGRPGMIFFEEGPAHGPPAPARERVGVMVFEEGPVQGPAPSPTAANASSSVVRPVVPADLKAQVRSICGGQAQNVEVEVQRDGSLLVTVKVPNAAAEKRLTSKILTIPAMAAPNIRLAMQVGS